MNRRAFLSLAGAGIAGLAGCASGSRDTPSPTPGVTPSPTPIPGPKRGEDLPSDPDHDDGYPPEFATTPAPPTVDPASFETIDVRGAAVPLAPIEVTYRWYARGTARFADARGTGQYERAHVYGAVSSPAPDGGTTDPVDDWPTGDRIVCYCTCPHHLSSIRAADLISSGYEEVYVIDEGFEAWYERDYPVAGSEVAALPDPWTISGRVRDRYADGSAWARHPPTNQQEAAPIAADGSYELELRFSGVSADAEIVVETPGYRVTGRLGALADGVVTGESG